MAKPRLLPPLPQLRRPVNANLVPNVPVPNLAIVARRKVDAVAPRVLVPVRASLVESVNAIHIASAPRRLVTDAVALVAPV